MRFLRTNTAVIVTVGPFYDKTDGVTIETALTITNERLTLTADTDDGAAPTNILDNITGATAATANDLNYITGNDAGMMQLELSAANTNRLGRMFLSITDAANHVPVFHEFMVLPAMIYDAFILGTDVLDASVTQILGTAAATPATAGILEVNVKNFNNLAAVALPLVPTTAGRTLDVSVGGEAGLDWANIGSPTTANNLSATNIDVDQIVASVSGAVGSVTGAVGSVAAGGITASSIAADAIGASELAADAVAEIADAIWDEDATGHQTLGTYGQAIGDPVADTNTIYKAVVTDAAGATVGVDVVAVQTDTDDIQARLPAALTAGGNMKSDALALSGDTVAADNSESFFDGTGYAGTGNTIPTVTTVSGNVNGSVGSVAAGGIATTSFAAGAIDAAAIAASAIGTSEFAAAVDARIVDSVWDEARSGHNTAGTYGEPHFGLVNGAAIAGTLTTTAMTTDLTEATDDHYNGRTIVWTSGVLAGQATNITDYTGATKLLTYTAVTEAPTATDKFVIY